MRYPVLKTLSIIYKLLGLLLAATAITTFVFAEAAVQRWLDELAATGVAVMTDHRITAALIPALFFVIGLVFAVTCYALGEFIKLMIDVEANTRGTYRQGQQERAAPRQRDLWAEP